ncbi:isoaspartyl peptidase/L-asparaginase family protein [Solilutibacter silvestris]|uniref:Isoaspartyl peptidase n=1 Tax=Solilutibacter silvestris TaxID=1645665 RepID=A0A2K1PXQ7_9GAMM|nr:isoaspartyl peptidase/L-asparaginase [Lysobacter silvestris]PNS07563.1 Asparaginase [Lysobacter silvestris]
MRTFKIATLALALAAASSLHAAEPVLIVHGGAGVIRKENNKADEAAVRKALETALRNGYAELKAGKSSADAVVAAIRVLEDDPHFNAGKGAVFTHDGKNELDASIMDGDGQRAGAVAAVHRVRNPITLARAVMEKSEHVMLVGDGAETFAREQGVTLVDPSYFRTEKRWQQLQKILKEEAAKQASTDPEYVKHIGTTGAAALDSKGHLAAGTSTGGMTNKRWGRVGDSPIIGAGTWADDSCAFSGTGWGEYYIRTHAASNVCGRVKFLKETAAQAGGAVINGEVVKMGGDGGAIVLTSDGKFAFPFNTEGMYRGWIGADGIPHVALYADDGLEGDVVLKQPAPAATPTH